MPATAIKSSWYSGDLIFHEKTSAGYHTTYNVLKIGDDAVKVGDTGNDIDFQYYGSGSISAIIDCGAKTLTLVGIALSTNGALTITNATATSSTTTGALIVTGGIATAADITCGDDLFMSNGGVINFNSGNVTITHSAGKLTIALPAPTGAIDGVTVSMTGGAATQGTIRGFVSSVTGFATAMTSGSLVGIRGVVTLGANTSGSYVYGTQGKLITGSYSLSTGSSHYCGVMAQVDVTGGTLTSGHIACLIASIQDSGNSAALNMDGIYVELPTYGSGSRTNAVLRANGASECIIDASACNGASQVLFNVATTNGCWSATQGSGDAGKIAVKLAGTTKYLYVYDS